MDENGISGLEKATIREKHREDLKKRVKIGNESTADIFVSIHLNKIPQTQYAGWQTFFKQGDEKSEKLAKELQEGLNNTIQRENKRKPLKITRHICCGKRKNTNFYCRMWFFIKPRRIGIIKYRRISRQISTGNIYRNHELLSRK